MRACMTNAPTSCKPLPPVLPGACKGAFSEGLLHLCACVQAWHTSKALAHVKERVF